MSKIQSNLASARRVADELIEQGKLSQAEAKVAIDTATTLRKPDLTPAERDTYEPMAIALEKAGGPSLAVFRAAYGGPLEHAAATLEAYWGNLMAAELDALYSLRDPTHAQQQWLEARATLSLLQIERERLVHAAPGTWKDAARNERRGDVEQAIVQALRRVQSFATRAAGDIPEDVRLGDYTIPELRTYMQLHRDSGQASFAPFGFDSFYGGYCLPGDRLYADLILESNEPGAVPTGDIVCLDDHQAIPQKVAGTLARHDQTGTGECEITCAPTKYDQTGRPRSFGAEIKLGNELFSPSTHCTFRRQGDGSWRARNEGVEATVRFNDLGEVVALALSMTVPGGNVRFEQGPRPA